jgi:hypothetical protein
MFGSKKKEVVEKTTQQPSNLTPYDCVLNLFYNVNRNTGDLDLRNSVKKSAQVSIMLTLKTIAYIRNVRGERELGRSLLGWLQKFDEQQLIENMPLFLNKYGRYDDLVYLPRKSKAMYAYLKYLGEQLVADLANMELGKPVSSAAKWVPSETSAVNKKTAITFRLARAMKVSMSDLRKKYLTPLRAYIGKRFAESPIITTSLPHEIIAPYFNGLPLDDSIETKWREVTTKMKNTVVLGNKSLISTSIGLLADHFITMDSSVPKIAEITGSTVFEKVQYISALPDDDGVIDICATLKLIFDNMGADKLIIVSDKPLNKADSLYNDATKETVDKMLLEAGLKIPQIVFWNVAHDSLEFSEAFGMNIVSGYSKDVLQCIMNNELPRPLNVMMNALSNEMFDDIKIREPTVPL